MKSSDVASAEASFSFADDALISVVCSRLAMRGGVAEGIKKTHNACVLVCLHSVLVPETEIS